MTNWKDFAAEEPEFAGRVQQRFTSQKQMTLATLRRDGSPRISGTEVTFTGEHVQIGMMPRSVKSFDVLRDRRLAVHSPTADPPIDDPTAWEGDAKLAGYAIALADPDSADPPGLFNIEIIEVVMTSLGDPPDHLVIESWTPQRGYQLRHRR